ncbi:hypothetical protein P368_13485 [Comamonas thiooxydans]|nr:hypothetical protein P369_15935 [Comamonas thiooxydans]KGH03969.1 hypothetical protein P365_14825 [Comamonas thiooxydans]KGH11337.1 hypothetical protein P368_13485 [Comamonas thiooxydans]
MLDHKACVHHAGLFFDQKSVPPPMNTMSLPWQKWRG